jgi:hypothetical protein
VSEAGLMADEHLAGAEGVPIDYLFPAGPDLSISALTVSCCQL